MEINKVNEEIEIDFKEIFQLLWSKIIIIILVGIVFGIMAFLVSKLMISPIYQSSTLLYVIDDDDTSTLSDVQLATEITKDCKIIIMSRPVMEGVINGVKDGSKVVVEGLGEDISPEALAGKITVNTPSGTRSLEIVVSDTDPQRAKHIAESMAVVAQRRIKEVTLQNITIIEEGNLPLNPVSPNTKRNAMLGAALGMFIVCAVILIRYFLDDTIKDPDDIERRLGLSTLASIPECEAMDDGNKAKKGKQVKNNGNVQKRK